MLLLLLLDVFTSAEEETASLEGPDNDGMMLQTCVDGRTFDSTAVCSKQLG